METLLIILVPLGLTGLCRLLVIHPVFARKLIRYLIVLMAGALLLYGVLDGVLNLLPTDKIRMGIIYVRKFIYPISLAGILIGVFLTWLSLKLEGLKEQGK